MKYSDYVKLGFKRIDLEDNVEYQNTGYSGFVLEKKVNSRMFINVSSGELDKPRLYILKRKEDALCHILNITPECVNDLCSKD